MKFEKILSYASNNLKRQLFPNCQRISSRDNNIIAMNIFISRDNDVRLAPYK